jgi:drug/metabolite transporter (DMT)-like permease
LELVAQPLDRFFHQPLKVVWIIVARIVRAFWTALTATASFLIGLLRRVRREVWIGIGVSLASIFVLLVAGYIAFFSWVGRQMSLPERIDQVYYYTQPRAPTSGTCATTG